MKLAQQQNTSEGGQEKQINYVTKDDLCRATDISSNMQNYFLSYFYTVKAKGGFNVSKK